MHPLAVEAIAIDRVIPYARNPRHNASAIAKVASSLKEFGWRQPIVVDAEMVVVVGHTRLEAARSLGMTQVPVHIAGDLTPTQAKAYRLADNRTGEEATWDEALLGLELIDLRDAKYDLLFTGFDDLQLTKLLAGTSPVTPADADDQVVDAAPVTPITQPGDLILLGQHRLVCGDATDPRVWRQLLVDERAAMLWTDPPYGVAYADLNKHRNARARKKGGKSRSIETPIENDDLNVDQLQALLTTAFTLALEYSQEGAAWYVAAPAGPQHRAFVNALAELKVWRQTLQWVKQAFVMGRSDYHYRHEPIFYGWAPGAAHHWFGARNQDTVIEFARPRSSDLHPTMKPVQLITACLANSAEPGAIVVDAFAGSGSTLIACETAPQGRYQARCIELSPAYCDVIVARYEGLTGRKAVRP